MRSIRAGGAKNAENFCKNQRFTAFFIFSTVVTAGGCFERTEISFISFRWWIQTSLSITCPLKEQTDCTRQIHRRSPWCSLQGAFSQEKKVQNQIYLNTKRDLLHFCKRYLLFGFCSTKRNLYCLPIIHFFFYISY